MNEQNPWKKQMLANKNKPNDTKPEPPKIETNNSNQPPWVKNNQTSTPILNNWAKNNPPAQNTNNNQPPWVKNNIPTNNPQPNAPPSPKPNPVGNANTNPPPWTKQKEETSSAPSPPWPKQTQDAAKSSPVIKPTSATAGQSPPANNPPWMKTNSTQETAPAWANKNNSSTSSPQPSWANKGASNPSPNPPWMKSGESPLQNSNQIKAQKIADMQRQKKEMEEKQRQLQQEEKERKRQERLRKEAEEQEANQLRENLALQAEEEHSANRQRFDREQLQRKASQLRQKEKLQRQAQQRQAQRARLQKAQRARLQKQRLQAEWRQKQRMRAQSQQRTRLQNQRIQVQKLQKSKSRSGNKSRRALQTSKISHISSIRGAQQQLQSSSLNAFDQTHPPLDPSLPENLFHRYTRLTNEECEQPDYREKIALQRAIIQTQLQFKKQCEAEIVQLIQKKKVTNRKRKIVLSNNMQIRYGLCEGKKGESGLQFSTEEGEKLRNLFLYYEAITKCIVSLLKRKINIHFRVPLLNLAQYKGITFLMEYLSPELLEINETDIGLFQEISNEVLILEKELQLCYDSRNDFLRPLVRSQLMVKKVSIYREDYYVLYIKEDSLQAKSRTMDSPNKNTNKVQAIPTLNLSYLKVIEYITDEATMLPFYSPPLLPKHNLDFYQKAAPPACKHLIREITLANSINTVYSSCQGEVDENIFFSLVIGESKEVWQMIRSAGFASQQVPSAIALSYLQKIAVLRFAFTAQLFSKKQKIFIESVKPSVYIQKHEFQLLEFIKNTEKYIGEEKQDLVEQSMRMNRQLWEDIDRSSAVQEENRVFVNKVKKEVSYLLFRKKQSEALQLLQNCQSKLAPFAIQNVSLSLLFLKIYVSMDSEMELLKKLSQLLQILQFYFKEETIIHSYVYTIVGSYYASKLSDTQRESKVITFYEHAINIALKLYGEKAQQVAQIYLSRASAMLCLSKNDSFQKDMACALKIYKIHSKNNSKIAQCNYLLGKAACSEGKLAQGIDLMQSSSALFLKMENYLQSLKVSFELLHFLQGEQAKYQAQIQRIVETCFRHKSVWALQRIVTLLLDRQLHCYTSLTTDSLLQICHNQQKGRSREEVMVDLEQEIKGFTSFIEIVRWALSILAARVLIRKETSSDYWKALNIMKDVIQFYSAPHTVDQERETV